MFHSLLKKQLSGSELHQLAAACDTLPADVENAGFARGVLAFIVKSFADSADRESLVRLLSTRCPCSLDGPETIEFVLAAEAKRLKDPILILGEAYAPVPGCPRPAGPSPPPFAGASLAWGFAERMTPISS